MGVKRKMDREFRNKLIKAIKEVMLNEEYMHIPLMLDEVYELDNCIVVNNRLTETPAILLDKLTLQFKYTGDWDYVKQHGTLIT